MRFVGKPWTAAHRRQLMQMRDNGIRFAVIAKELGHPVGSCVTMARYIRIGHRSLDEPGQRRKGGAVKKWTSDQVALMEQMIVESMGLQRRGGNMRKRRISWVEISEATGHSIQSCIHRHKYQLEKEINRKLREQANAPEVARAQPVMARSSPVTTYDDLSRPTSTAGLMAHAMIRDRIATQGITAGLLGDPAPGRSALDRKLAGVVEPEIRLPGSYRAPPPVTLATEPQRS